MDKDKEIGTILLRLRSYLISLIHSPIESDKEFELVIEFMNRVYPDRRDEIIEMLIDNDIKSDNDLVFAKDIQDKIRKMSAGDTQNDLLTILDKANVKADDLLLEELQIETLRKDQDEQIKQIVSLLVGISNEWIGRQNIEEDIVDYSALDEEELLRPDEEAELELLSNKTNVSFTKISTLNLIYLKLYVDYLFENGGNISLKNFVEKLDKIRDNVEGKYKKLFKEHGLDQVDDI